MRRAVGGCVEPRWRTVPRFLGILGSALIVSACTAPAEPEQSSITVEFSAAASQETLDGRVIVILTRNDEEEPRFQVRPGVDAPQIFGVTVDGLGPGDATTIDGDTFGYPYDSLNDVPPGDYFVQAVLHRYDDVELGNGKVVSLPLDRGEGQQWERSPGNLYSEPRTVSVTPGANLRIVMDSVIEPIEPPADTNFVKHVKIRSERLSKFWGRDMYLAAHVLLPAGFDEHPEARYPLAVWHGHFPADFQGFRTEPPDENLECASQGDVPCYNRIRQEEAYDFFRKWTSPEFPRMLIIQIQHQNPYYDDSYAVNSANLGPYGDAITYELIPHIEQQFRGIGEGWARFLYGGSTGGWESFAATGVLSRRIQRHVCGVPRLARLPPLPVRQHLRGRQCVSHDR